MYEFFNIENNINYDISAKFIEFFANNKVSNKLFIKLADEGMVI